MLFEAIQGQEKAKRLLERVLQSERISHAYLFAGPEGVGKVSTAKLFANIILCTGPAVKPCFQCPGCRKFQSGNHSDFVHIQPDGVAIKINQVRALKETVTYAPFEGGCRIVVIEDVHTMRKEAGNSLLKILEEPPPQNILILTGGPAEAILPTILSRCQVVPFFPLTEEAAASVVSRHRPEMELEHAVMLSVLAGGSPGRALALETGGLFEVYSRFEELLLKEYAEAPLQIESGLAFAMELSKLKEELFLLLHLLRIFFKNALVVKNTDVSWLADKAQVLNRARELWNFDQLSAKIESIDFAERALNRNCNRGLVCEVLMLNLFQR